MKRWSPSRLMITIGVSFGVWAIIAALCLMIGSTGTGWPSEGQFAERWRRVLDASLIGAALSAAGVVYQAILRNPLAEPYLLGVSSGASLASYLWQLPKFAMLAGAMAAPLAAISQQAFAFAGAILAIAVVFLLSSRRGRIEPITLVLVGVIVNIMLGALFLFIDAIMKSPAQGSILNFLVGGIQTNITASARLVAFVLIALTWLLLLYISGPLNAASLSDAEAITLGVRIHRLRWVALLVASLMTASAVAISGPIGFLGLICPHLSRLFVGNDQRRLLPVATAVGAGVLAVADSISRYLAGTVAIGTVLPVGVLTGMLGGPFFLLILWQNRRRSVLLEMGG
jgi:iron complex transport system permease protein